MSTISRRRTRVVTVLAALAAALAVVLGTAGTASAETNALDPYRPVLPYDAQWVVGNPANIVSAAAPSQVVTIPAGSGWAAQLRTQDAASSPAQTWQFTLVGRIPMTYTEKGLVGGQTYPITVQMPVWQIINQQGSNRTCLEANGSGSIGVGTQVDFYGCNPNSPNQPNQLWVVVGNDHLWGDGKSGTYNSINSADRDLFAGSAMDSVALVNYDTFLSGGKDLSKALVISAADQVNGIHSGLTLQQQQSYPKTNKLWKLKDMNPAPATTGSGNTSSSCKLFGCLVDLD